MYKGYIWEQELSVDSAYLWRNYFWRSALGTSAHAEIWRLGPRGPREVPTTRDRTTHVPEERRTNWNNRVGATKMDERCREGRIVKPALGGTFPSRPNDHFFHQATALSGTWWVLVVVGAHPHHKPFDSQNYQAPLQRGGPNKHLVGKEWWFGDCGGHEEEI